MNISTFEAWHNEWERLGQFEGPQLPDPDRRIREVVALWPQPIPGEWIRSGAYPRARLLSKIRYTRTDLKASSRTGEHEIEYEILIKHFDQVNFLGLPLLDGVNAYPLTKDASGGRRDNVEADLLLLLGPARSATTVLCEVKKTDSNAWCALVQNLRQLRLYLANPVCSSLFAIRGVAASVLQVHGAVVAPISFYSGRGQKANSVPHARRLSESLLKNYQIQSALLTWDPKLNQVKRYM